MTEIDKQIHRDEIKLRLLLTNKCNFNCSWCLNDFMEKGTDFLYEDYALKAITYYKLFFDGKVPLQVYFSGGEPTLHSCLPTLLKYAKLLNCRTTVISNASNPIILEKIRSFIDCLHISVYVKNNPLSYVAKKLNADLQTIYSLKHPFLDDSFINYYIKQGFNLKIFQNFFDDFDIFYRNLANRYKDEPKVQFRFTGKQENRGIGCKDCTKKCITLKAAWVFPDGGITPCPQLVKHKKMYPISSFDWLNAYKRIYEFHKVEMESK